MTFRTVLGFRNTYYFLEQTAVCYDAFSLVCLYWAFPPVPCAAYPLKSKYHR